jgi:glc operon protein GlcG
MNARETSRDERHDPLANARLTGYWRPGFAARYDECRPRPPTVLADVLRRLARIERPALVVDLGLDDCRAEPRTAVVSYVLDPPHSIPRRSTMTIRRLVSLVLAVAVVSIAAGASAQAPVAPPPPQIPYGAPITLDQAKKATAGAEAEATKNKWSVVITILDSGGNLVISHRMDGTQLGSLDAARDKAYSAVAYRRPTKVFQDLVGQGGANLRLLRLAGASPLEGGIPIIVDGKLIGAIGVSGMTSEQDAQIATAGITALGK